MDVTDDVVDVFLIDDNLGLAALDEDVFQLVHAARFVNRTDFGARYHTIAHLDVGEVEGILEYLHFIGYFLFRTGIVDA